VIAETYRLKGTDFVCDLTLASNYPEKNQPIALVRPIGTATYLRRKISAIRLRPLKADFAAAYCKWALKSHYLPTHQPRASDQVINQNLTS
jgi:hypothetical protein